MKNENKKEKTVTGGKIVTGEKSAAEKNLVTWYLDNHGILTVEGTGQIPDACCGSHPAPAWEQVKDLIREIHVMEGIEAIGLNAFRECRNLTKVVLSYTVNRIHAHAFRGCTALENVDTERNEFRMLGDPFVDDPEDTVIFSIESFRGTPWIRRQFGDFYIQNGELYAAFAGDGEDLVIPGNVRIFRPYCLSHLNLNSLRLPERLRYIGSFAFQGTRVESVVDFPVSVTGMDAYALADCGIRWRGSQTLLTRLPDEILPEQRHRFPSAFHVCRIETIHRRAYGNFERLCVKLRRIPAASESLLPSGDLPAANVDGTSYAAGRSLTSRIIDTSIDVGEGIYRRIRRGSLLICVKYSNDHVLCLESFIWNRKEGLVNEYLMYPTQEAEEEGFSGLVPWRDSFTWQEKEDIVSAFYGCCDGKLLAESGSLRLREDGSREEWFRSGDARNFGGPLELDFLKMWLGLHPGIRVDSQEENAEHDRRRWFVPV